MGRVRWGGPTDPSQRIDRRPAGCQDTGVRRTHTRPSVGRMRRKPVGYQHEVTETSTQADGLMLAEESGQGGLNLLMRAGGYGHIPPLAPASPRNTRGWSCKCPSGLGGQYTRSSRPFAPSWCAQATYRATVGFCRHRWPYVRVLDSGRDPYSSGVQVGDPCLSCVPLQRKDGHEQKR